MAILGRGQPFRPQIKVPVDVLTYVYIPITQVRAKPWVKRSHSVRPPIVYTVTINQSFPICVRRSVQSKVYIHRRHPFVPIPAAYAFVPSSRTRNTDRSYTHIQVRQAALLPDQVIFVPLTRTRQQQVKVWSPRKYPPVLVPSAEVYVPVTRRRNINRVYVYRSVRPAAQHQIQIYIPTFTRRIKNQTTIVTRRFPPVIVPATREFVPLVRFRRVYHKTNQVRTRPYIPHQAQFLVPAPPRRVLQKRVDVHHRHDIPLQTNYHTPVLRRNFCQVARYVPRFRQIVVEQPRVYVPVTARRNLSVRTCIVRVRPAIPFQTVVENFVPIVRTRRLYSYVHGVRRGFPFVSAITQDVVVSSRRCMR